MTNKQQRGEHLVVNITNLPFEVDRMQSLPNQVLEHYEKKGWQLCAIDNIHYFFIRFIKIGYPTNGE